MHERARPGASTPPDGAAAARLAQRQHRYMPATLLGYIAQGGQYFRASQLVWDQSSQSVTTSEVRYVGPSVEVTGEKMHVNLATGQVRFDGPVEVGI